MTYFGESEEGFGERSKKADLRGEDVSDENLATNLMEVSNVRVSSMSIQ